ISVKIDRFEDDLVFDYKALDKDLKNANEENIEKHNDINNKEYKKTRCDNN
ncbi:12841_t:CDS:1, partial [Cetraspora pellucida]